MARKISGGLVGQPSVGEINVASSAIITTAQDQDITISPLGVGALVLTNNAVINSQNSLRFADQDSTNYVGFRAPATITSDLTWTLPAIDGSDNQVLSTNGTGTLSWSDKTTNITNNTSTSTIHYLSFTTTTSGTVAGFVVSDTKLSFQPSTGTLSLGGGTSSTDTTTGTLVVTGGVGISGNLNIGGSLGVGAISGVSGYIPLTSGTSLTDADRKYIVSNTAAITLTLPATSVDGRTIVIVDGNNFGVNNVTLARNTKTIGGLAEDLVLNVQGSRVELVYRGGDWKVFAS